MYEPRLILEALDNHTVPILVGFGLSMVFQTIAMVTAVLMTRRDGWISIPLPCTFLWFAHDLGVVVRFDIWFNDIDHWFFKLFWVGLLSALLLECVFLAQAMRVGRKEYLPRGTQAQWNALLFAGAALFVLCWEYQKTIWDDPLYQALASTTLYVIPLAVVPLVLRRRSAIAQSPVIYASFRGDDPVMVGRDGRRVRRRFPDLAVSALRDRGVRDIERIGLVDPPPSPYRTGRRAGGGARQQPQSRRGLLGGQFLVLG